MASPPHKICSTCGLEIPPFSPGSRCLRCLLDLALTPPSEDSADPPAVPLEGTPRVERQFHGDYEVLDEICRGGMGVVYRARQLSVGRLVALKRMDGSSRASPEVRLRFQVEAAAVGRLNHPNIVSLIECGEWKGELYFTMTLVDGPSLSQVNAACASRDRPWLQRMARILATVARAIHHAHQRGVLHRDLKPSNVVLEANDEPKVADFGLAKILESDAGLTRSESILGSPNYMAPEQAAGPAHLLTTAADVYSVGAILYELICGRPPFQAPTAVETMRRVVDSPPVPPRRINPAIDRDLESVCLKCLEKQPQHRYGSAAELASDLQRWLEHRPLLARPIPSRERFWRWCRRSPALASLAGVCALCMLALAAGSVLAFHRIQSAHREARDLLHRLQWEKAEAYLEKDDSARGLALFAHLLRERPEDTAIGIRLKSALQWRPLAVPMVRPWVSGSETLVLGFDPSSSHGAALSRRGRLHLQNLVSGVASEHELSGSNKLTHAALSTEAQWLATAHADGELRIWNLDRPETPHARWIHPAQVTFLEFDAHGRRLATGGTDRMVREWDTATGNQTRRPREHPTVVHTARFSPDGHHLATGAEDGFVRVWPVDTDQAPRTLGQLAAAVRVIGFDARGERLAAGTVGGHVQVWRLTGPSERGFSAFFQANLTDLQFSPDGRWLAAAGWSPLAAAHVWNADSGKPATTPLQHRSQVNQVRFSPDSRRLLTVSSDTTARVWSTADWTPLTDPMVHVGGVVCGSWSSDSRRVGTGSFAGAVWWEIPEARKEPKTLPLPKPVRATLAGPPGDRLLTLSSDGTLQEWAGSAFRPIREVSFTTNAIEWATFGPGGGRVATVSPNQEIRVFSTNPGNSMGGPLKLPRPLLFILIPHADDALVAGTRDGTLWRLPISTNAGTGIELCRVQGLLGAALSPDGRRLATFASFNAARVWDARTGQPLTSPLEHEGYVDGGVFSPDGSLLATASRDSCARVWDVRSGALVGRALRHNARVHGVTFDPAGRRVATACADGTARIWRMGAIDAPPVVIQHADNVRRTAFSADGRWLLTVSQDTVVRLWDPQTGLPISEPFPHPARVDTADFLGDGRAAWTVTSDGVVRLWPLPAFDSAEANWLPEAAEVIGRMFLEPPSQFRVTPASKWETFGRRRESLLSAGN